MNNQFFKYLLFFTHIVLFFILYKIASNTEGWLSIFAITIIVIHSIYTLILLMISDSNSNRVYLFYPKLKKKNCSRIRGILY